jgi:hypothetical protein
MNTVGMLRIFPGELDCCFGVRHFRHDRGTGECASPKAFNGSQRTVSVVAKIVGIDNDFLQGCCHNTSGIDIDIE